ncbi:hypothetical protein AVEN_111480-1 [Araneus ventricosus]|uniref:Uncharacterized protein n=1 Tax=Araneus ventricosus TaxID=182803 RepID=A0A4Y2UCL2_ARAVE|nr:hypothetical protein AVEN_111480-1 [Araneus ventricosus]
MLQISVFNVPKTVRSEVERRSFYWPSFNIAFGPDIRKLLPYSLFSETMGEKEKEACDSFEDIVHRFWENTKDRLCKTIVQRILNEAQGCKMSLKFHFLHSHIVKSRAKDFTRMSVISRDDTKEDGKSPC